jgi:anti-sigma factor RsiW
MHAVVMESLEEFLAGTLEPEESHTIQEHIGNCAACREEIQAMQDVSLLFGSLQVKESMEVPAGFYARVRQQVEERAAAPSWNSFFALNPAVGRRLVFSCLVVLVAMGTYLVSSEREYTSAPMPDAVMAEQTQPSFESALAPENMLVTLANYEH